jgi:hypothetical protein
LKIVSLGLKRLPGTSAIEDQAKTLASHIKWFDDRIDDVWSYSGGSEPATERAG